MRKLQYIGDSWKGLQRDSNKDGFHALVTPNYALFLVFDGVSSSKNAKEGVDALIKFSETSHPLYYYNYRFHLKDMMEDMNLFLLKMNSQGLYTTCCLAYVPLDETLPLKIAHLGDSRIYGINGTFRVYTEDHSNPGQKNMLLKCLGLKSLVKDDFYDREITQSPKRLFLCTDGFYQVMEQHPDLFLQLLKGPDLGGVKIALQKLIENQNGDDATYLLVSMN